MEGGNETNVHSGMMMNLSFLKLKYFVHWGSLNTRMVLHLVVIKTKMGSQFSEIIKYVNEKLMDISKLLLLGIIALL